MGERAVRGIASRRVLLVCGGVLIVVVAVAGALGLGGNGPDAAGNQAQPTGATVEITKGTLTNATTVSGELNHGTETPIALKASGTVTWLPPEGTVVGRGEPLLRVDDRPVVLLFGDLPAYRDLAEATAPPAPPKAEGHPTPAAPAPPVQPFTGRDVEQFESNLAALGYGGFTVDRTFTAQTTTAVKRWQKDLGAPQSGTVGAGDVFYAAGPLRVAKVLVRPGAPATGDLLSYTGTTRSVRVKVPAAEAGWAVAGTAVTVTLPDGKAVAGTVTSTGTSTGQVQAADAQPADANAPPPSVQVVVDIPDQGALGTLDRSPVTIGHVTEKREDVLSVPVAALLALAEGGYGLEVVDGATTRIVPVKTGLFADGRVEVSGTGVEQGEHVRLPG